jgi:ArsR family transcriptional regulator, arsenate/arsenite/antimonite-responsive transcriptional repressor
MSAEKPDDPPASLDRIELVCRALSVRPRREIVRLLSTAAESSAASGVADCCSAKDVCACVFAEKLGLSAPTVSHHMKTLGEAGLVTAEKRGLWVYYSLVPEALMSVARELNQLAGCPEEGEGCGC